MYMRAAALAVFIAGASVAFFVYTTTANSDSAWPFRLGLDLAGGTHLVYHADVSEVAPERVDESMAALRDVIERRVNLFGVSEPLVQTQRGSALTGTDDHRLIVELPGVTDTQAAIAQIGATPVLEFKLLKEDEVVPDTTSSATLDDAFTATGLTGRLVERAALEFGTGGGVSNEPVVALTFNKEGATLFEELTTNNVGRILGVFLDGTLIEAPVIREPIPGGTAVISGGFDAREARALVRDLNFGALPVPIELGSSQTIGATLGSDALAAGLVSALWGLALVALFMLVWYRVPGLIAVVSLGFYIALILALFKVIPVTLTAAGLAGFILSIGMAVDANVLIFERMREQLKAGGSLHEAIRTGFARSFPAIRDGNLTSVLIAIILFWFGTSLVEGFALVFGIGVLVSMLTAITVTRTFLLALVPESPVTRAWRRILGSGIF